MIEKVKVLIDGEELFKVSSISLSECIHGFISTRNTDMNFVLNRIEMMKFQAKLNKKNVLPIEIQVADKVWQKSYIDAGTPTVSIDAISGFSISLPVIDIFAPISGEIHGDVIDSYYVTHSTVDGAIKYVLSELGFDTKNTFKVVYGNGISPIKLTNGGNKEATHGGSASDFLGNICSLYHVILRSNGVDTITIEKYNSNTKPTYNLYVELDTNGNIYRSNTEFVEKKGSDSKTPARAVIINSNKKAKDTSISSVIVNFAGGMPYSQSIKRISSSASYSQIAEGINYKNMGMTARANSYTYGLPARVFDKNGNFFSVNTLVSVLDEVFGINEPMNILGFTTVIDAESGSKTTMNIANTQSLDTLDNLKVDKSLIK
jgi:hypothetical protein